MARVAYQRGRLAGLAAATGWFEVPVDGFAGHAERFGDLGDGVLAAIAAGRQVAGDKDVSIASASIAAQALDLGLVDEVIISLVPVLIGKGIPYFAGLARAPHRFDDPVILPGSRVTHLRHAIRRTAAQRDGS